MANFLVTRYLSLFTAGCFLLGLSSGHAAEKLHLKISANSQIDESYKKWTATTPWDQITTYSNPNANRPTVDLLLQLQALKAGGLDFDFELLVAPNFERAKAEVIQGSADLTAETIWDNEILNTQLLRTDPIIREGEFEKGIYALPGNEKILKVSSIEDIRAFTGITVATWPLDVATLQGMQLKGFEKGPKIENVFLMISKQRADFTIMEFSANPDLSNEINGVKLIPVPNCKVAIKGSRSWVVSKASQNAQQIHSALVKGAKALRDEGRIERAFKESGFLNQKVADWKRLF